MIDLNDIRNDALGLVFGAVDGTPLDTLTAELIAFAVSISVTALDEQGARTHATNALAAGATPEQLHEVSLLVAGLGVHSLFVGTRLIASLTPSQSVEPALDVGRQKLWDQWVGNDKYWKNFEREIPGFMRDLLEASPAGFDAFFRFCAVPWQNPQVSPLCKELIAMATDATPTHRYMPGMRLHLNNALKLGSGRLPILQALEIASRAPGHVGIG